MDTTNKHDLFDGCRMDLIIIKLVFSSSTNGTFTKSGIKQAFTFYRNNI